jgi:hypothetical protein
MGEQALLPEECARAYGQTLPVPLHAQVPGGGAEAPTWRHRAASALHGWDEDAHHAKVGRVTQPRQITLPDGTKRELQVGDIDPDLDERLRLTRVDYEAALKAVEDCDETGEPYPHLPAFSPHVHRYAERKERGEQRESALSAKADAAKAANETPKAPAPRARGSKDGE